MTDWLNAVSIIDIVSGTLTPLTSEFMADYPKCSPDGQRVLFRRLRDRKFNRARSSIRRTYGAIADPARAAGRAAA